MIEFSLRKVIIYVTVLLTGLVLILITFIIQNPLPFIIGILLTTLTLITVMFDIVIQKIKQIVKKWKES